MSLLTVVPVLAMLLWALGFVVSGLVLAEEVLWRRPGGKGSLAMSPMRRPGAGLLIGFGGILVMTAAVTGVLGMEREVRALEGKVSQESSVSPRPPAKSP